MQRSNESKEEKRQRYSLADIQATYKKRYASNPSILRAAFPTQDIWRLFVAGCCQTPDYFFRDEIEKPGYWHAMTSALDIIFDVTQPLDLDLIKKFHAKATQNVKGLHYDEATLEKFKDSNKRPTELWRVFTTDISSQEGIKELLDRIQNQSEEKYSQELEASVYGYFPAFTPEKLQAENKNDENYNAIIAKKIYQNMRERESKECQGTWIFKSKKNSDADIDHEMNQLINTYHRDIQSAFTKEQQLKVIVTFAQQLKQLQYFLDGNSSLFYLFLQHLLVRNDCMLTMLYNPHRFDGCSQRELLADVMDGQQRVLDFLATGKVYGYRTEDLLAILVKEHQDYFNTISTLEKTNRQNRGIIPMKALVSPSRIGPAIAALAAGIIGLAQLGLFRPKSILPSSQRNEARSISPTTTSVKPTRIKSKL